MEMSGTGSGTPKENAWLWRNRAFSDVTLLVYPAGDGPDGAWTAGKPEPLAKLPLHSIVLASASPEHYRGHLLRLWQDKLAVVVPPATQSTTMAGMTEDKQAAVAHPAPATQSTTTIAGMAGGAHDQGIDGPPAAQAAGRGPAHTTDTSAVAGGAGGAPDQGTARAPAAAVGPAHTTDTNAVAGGADGAADAVAGGAGGTADQGAGNTANDLEPPAKRSKQATSHEGQQPSGPQAQRVADPQAAGPLDGCYVVAIHVLELTCFPGEPEAVPEAVLHHAYTGALPDDAHLLAWMMWRADYLDMHATVKACLAKLQAMANGSQLTVQDLIIINSLPALQTSNSEAAQQQVAVMGEQVLLAQLGKASRVLLTPQLLSQFVQLPFLLLKQWGTLKNIVIDSENTIAVLFTAWYNHQLSSAAPPASKPTEQQCKELSALICLDKLSPSFHLQALPRLKWYRPPSGLPEQHAVLRVLAELEPATGDTDSDDDWRPDALSSGGVDRLAERPKSLTIKWHLSRQQLHELWPATSPRLLGRVYYRGYVFTGYVRLPTSTRHKYHEADAVAQAALEAARPMQTLDAAGPAQTLEAAAGPPRTLSFYLVMDWAHALLKHGVGKKVPNPVTVLRMEYVMETPTLDLMSETIVGACSKDQELSFQVFQGGFSTFNELAAYLGMPATGVLDAPPSMSIQIKLMGSR